MPDKPDLVESDVDQNSNAAFADAMSESLKESEQISSRQLENIKNLILGSEILVHQNSRTQLPNLKLDEPVPVWKLISKFIGQDLTKVSLPVILNEPQSAL